MKRKLVKSIMTLLGITIFIYAIIISIDGIGRFAMILFGTIFTVIGSIMPIKK